MNAWWFAPIAIIIHMFAINRTQRKAFSAFVFALTFYLLLLHWTSIYVGSIPWVILATGLSVLYIPLALVDRYGMSAYPFIFLLLEEIRNLFPFGGFGWGRLAYSQADAPYVQLLRFGGTSALTAGVLILALFGFHLFNRNLRLFLLLPFAILCVPPVIAQDSTVSALLIQGNVPQYGLDFNARAKEVFFNHVKETTKALETHPKVDFIVWPENAVDVDPFRNVDVRQSLDSFKQNLIIGAIVTENYKILNASILWSNDKKDVYVKQHLTPFGEYIPIRSLAERVSPFVSQVQDFYPGNQSKIFTIGKAKIAPVICYELLDDQLLEKAGKNSNLIVVQTNSATFGESPESAQQLSITRIRAIEHSRNILSVSTTGYSAVIDYNGSILSKTQMGTADHLYAEVGLINQRSLRDKLGAWATIISLIWLLAISRRGYRYRR